MRSEQNGPIRGEAASLVAGSARATATRLRAALVLSMISLALMIVAATAGLLVDGLYPDPTSTSSMLRAYDLVTLVMVAPLLAISAFGLHRGSTRLTLLWLGMLAATVYAYAYYLFEAALSDAFLLHVAVFSAALFALVLGLSAIDVESIGQRFSPKTPCRWISGFLALLAAGLGGLWLFAAAQFALTGRVPTGSALDE